MACFCNNCGAYVPDGLIFCNVCGVTVGAPANVPAPYADGGTKRQNQNLVVIVAAAVIVAALIITCALLVSKNGSGSRGGSSRSRNDVSAVEEDGGKDKEKETEKTKAESFPKDAVRKAMDAICDEDSDALADMSADVILETNRTMSRDDLKQYYEKGFAELDYYGVSYSGYELGQSRMLSDNEVKALFAFYKCYDEELIEDYYGRIAQVETNVSMDVDGQRESKTVYLYLAEESGRWKLIDMADRTF